GEQDDRRQGPGAPIFPCAPEARGAFPKALQQQTALHRIRILLGFRMRRRIAGSAWINRLGLDSRNFHRLTRLSLMTTAFAPFRTVAAKFDPPAASAASTLPRRLSPLGPYRHRAEKSRKRMQDDKTRDGGKARLKGRMRFEGIAESGARKV